MNLRPACIVVYVVSVLLLGLAALGGSVVFMAAFTVSACSAYALRDYVTPEPDSVNVMTLYAAFAALWFGLGNLAGYILDPDAFPQFHVYDVPQYVYPAQVLASLGAVIPLLTYDLFHYRRTKSAAASPIPPVAFPMSDRDLVRFAVGLLVVGWTARLLGLSFEFLGTLNTLIGMGPILAIFILSSRWRSPTPVALPSWTRWLPVGVMAFEAVISLLFSNMRNMIVWPIAAYFLPFVLRKRVTVKGFAVGLVVVLCYSVVFRTIGEVRGKLFGGERLTYILQQSRQVEFDLPEEDEKDALGITTLLARLSTFNQLTQVVSIVDAEGFYDGETIGYALYAFVPRVIWPEKPTIAPGQWFARKLGRGSELGGTGQFSNAINMTIPGELYLNYGWLVTVLGLAAMGWLYALLWTASRYYEWDVNPIGQVFAYFLFAQAMFNGSHLGGVLNLLLWYIALLALSWVLQGLVRRVTPRGAAPGVPEERAVSA